MLTPLITIMHVCVSRHIALDRQHLEKSEAKLKKEVENRAAQPLEAKAKLEEKLSQVEVSQVDTNHLVKSTMLDAE